MEVFYRAYTPLYCKSVGDWILQLICLKMHEDTAALILKETNQRTKFRLPSFRFYLLSDSPFRQI